MDKVEILMKAMKAATDRIEYLEEELRIWKSISSDKDKRITQLEEDVQKISENIGAVKQ